MGSSSATHTWTSWRQAWSIHLDMGFSEVISCAVASWGRWLARAPGVRHRHDEGMAAAVTPKKQGQRFLPFLEKLDWHIEDILLD